MEQIQEYPVVDIVFAAIWLLAMLIFFYQAYSVSWDRAKILSFYPINIPSDYNMQVKGVRFQDVINGLISSYNENVLELQNSIRAAARLSLRLNLISGFMAMIGLAAQVGQAWKAWPT